MVHEYKMITWKQNIKEINTLLDSLSVTDNSNEELDSETGFTRWQEMSTRLRKDNGCIFLVGNGASASMASHFATDIAKNGGIRTQIFTDPSLITALGNDLSFEEIYAEPLRWHMKKGDMLVAISSSGNSPNIVRAVKTAKSLGGTVITISAMTADNAIRQKGDLNFYIPAVTYGMAETGHAAILHYWMDVVEKNRKDAISES